MPAASSAVFAMTWTLPGCSSISSTESCGQDAAGAGHRVAGVELVGGVELDRHRDRLRRRAPARGAPSAALPAGAAVARLQRAA